MGAVKRAVLAMVAACGEPSATVDGGDASFDASGPPQVSGTLQKLVTDNDASFHVTSHTNAIPPATVTLTAVLDDGTTTQPVLSDDGLFSFPLAHAGQRYQLTERVGTEAPATFDSTAASLTLGDLSLGRTDRVPITKSTIVNIAVPNFTANDFAIFDTTGAWSQANLTATSMTTFKVDLAVQGVWFDRNPSQLSAAEHDLLTFTEWRGITTSGPPYNTIVASFPQPISVADGQTVTLTGSVTPAPPACVHVDAPRREEQDRYLAVAPGPYSAVSDSWIIENPTAPGIGVSGLLQLAAATENQVVAMSTNQDITFGNPFGASHVYVQLQDAFSQAIDLPAGGGTAVASVGVSEWVDAPVQAGCPVATIPQLVAIPSIPTVAGADVTADTTVTVDPTAPVVVAWTLASPGTADQAIVRLSHVTTGLTVESTVFTHETSTTFDRARFVAGETYAISVTLAAGIPRAADGDFTAIAFPFGLATTITHAFKVQ